MDDNKRSYQPPQVEMFGSVEEITELHETNKGGLGTDGDIETIQHSGTL